MPKSATPARLALLLALLVPAACGGEGEPAPEPEAATAGATDDGPSFEDPDLTRLYDRMMAVMAPDDGRARLRYLQFTFVVDRGGGNVTRRSHRWDVWDGRYRLEAPVGDARMVALFDVDDPTGSEEIWLDGEPVADEARADSLARRAHAIFINDSYWLLMPYKWDDPGVHARLLGERRLEGRDYQVVELTFDSVGLTPRNKYRAWVDPDTHLMAYWQHYTEASDEEPRFTMAWTGWERYGPILLAPSRVDLSGELALRFEDLEASTSVPDGAFHGPGA